MLAPALCGRVCTSAIVLRTLSTSPTTTTKNRNLLSSMFQGVDARVWPIAVSSLLTGTAIGVVIPIMPVLGSQIGLPPSEYGLVVSVMGATRLLLNLPLAVLGDRFGRKPLLVYGPVCSSVSIAMTGFSASLQELLFWRFFTGAGGGAQMTGAHLYLADISTPQNRARTLAPTAAAFSMGMMVGPAIGGLLAHQFGIVSPFMFVSMAIATVALNNHFKLPETLNTNTTTTTPTNTTTTTATTTILSSLQKAFSQWKTLLSDRNVSTCSLLHCAFWTATSGAQITLMPLLAVQQFGMSLASIGGVFAIVSGINVVLSQPVAWLSDRLGRKAVLVPGALLSAASMASLSIATTQPQFWGIVVAWGIGNSFFGSTPTAYMSDITDNNNRAQALAMLRSAGDFGLMIGAAFSGVVAQELGMGLAMVTNAVIATCASLFFWFRAAEPRTLVKREEKSSSTK